MKRTSGLIVLALFCSALIAGSPGKSSDAWEKMKSLGGAWKGTTEDGKPVTITYSVVSGGSAVMESIDMEEHKGSMITMYTMDGDKLQLTHYCSMGNQPRMRASGLTADGKLAFMFVDGTNMKKSDSHMHALTLTFTGSDALQQDWTMWESGKDKMHAVFNMTLVP